MQTITIEELHEHTCEWVHRSDLDQITVTEKGLPVAVLLPIRRSSDRNPFLHRQLLPGYAEIMDEPVGGTDSTEIISSMRDGR
jgi:antitoxin (DNA-binding transcriptional repressor) of toxin-antitoxin stability system